MQTVARFSEDLPLTRSAGKVQLPVQAEDREFRPRRLGPGALAASAAGADADVHRATCEFSYGRFVSIIQFVAVGGRLFYCFCRRYSSIFSAVPQEKMYIVRSKSVVRIIYLSKSGIGCI